MSEQDKLRNDEPENEMNDDKINDSEKNLNNSQESDTDQHDNQQTGNGETDNEQADLSEKLMELEKELQNYKDRYLRKAAEFENYKRRTEKDQFNLINYAAESFITKLLPVVDDFERSLEHIEKNQDTSAVSEGVKLVYDKLVKLLDDQGVKKIEAIGKPFDVNLHEAILKQNDPSAPPDTVINEVVKGYTYKDRVIRHSKVIVSDEESGNLSESNSDSKNNSGNE